MQTVNIPTPDGLTLVGTLYEPTSSNGAFALISAATGIKRGYYHNFAQFLVEAGYTVLTYDYRGVGDSLPMPLKEYQTTMSAWGIHDLTAVFAWIEAEYGTYKLLMVAHSVGGVLLGLSPRNTQVQAAVLLASPNFYWRYASWLQRLILLFLCYLYIPLSERLLGYYKGSWVRTGEDLPKGTMREWVRWVQSPGYVRDCLAPEQLFYEQVRVPLYAFSFEDDAFVTPAAVQAMLKFYPHAHITYRQVNPAEVGGQTIGHTGFFRSRFKASLWQEVRGWLDQQR